MEKRSISLLHPSRQRFNRSIETTNKWIHDAANEVELIVSVDQDEPQLEAYQNHYGSKLIINPNRSAVDAINNAAKIATGDIMIVLSDDTACFHLWDTNILNECRGKSDFVLRVNDGIQNWLITAPIIDRAYYNRFGYVYQPDYFHLFCDTEFTHVADLTGRIIHSNLTFRHLHYCVGLAKKDALNERNDATWNEGKALYLKHCREGFGLGLNIWNITDQSHIKWLRNNL